jgi:hypothetical protein
MPAPFFLHRKDLHFVKDFPAVECYNDILSTKREFLGDGYEKQDFCGGG